MTSPAPDTSTLRPFPLPPYLGAEVGFATMHDKHEVVGPLLAPLGLQVRCVEFDTDVLGTFAGEVERPGPPAEMVRWKCVAGAADVGRFGLGSEGTFLPHPDLPVTVDVELVGLLDAASGCLVMGRAEAPAPWAVKVQVDENTRLAPVLSRLGFPAQHVVVSPVLPSSGAAPKKGLSTAFEVANAVADFLAQGVEVELLSDLRANRSPGRRRVIDAACADLLRRLCTVCTRCGSAGVGLDRSEPGLPCEWCASPTSQRAATVLRCPCCGSETRHAAVGLASPANCVICNP